MVGAGGRQSFVARALTPEQYNEKPPIEVSYYTYWSGLPMNGRFETYIRPGHGFAAWPTNDDLTLVVCGWPIAEFDAIRNDFENRDAPTPTAGASAGAAGGRAPRDAGGPALAARSR